MKQYKAMKLLILPVILSVLLTACGKNENTAESSSQAGEGMLSVVEEDSSKLPDSPLCVEKTANNTIIISYEDDMLASMKDRSEILINFFYDETRSDGYCLSSSPTFWALSKIQESGSNVAEGPDITKAGSKWNWEIQSQVFYMDIVNLSYFEAIYKDWDDADAFRTLAEGALSVEVDTQKIEEENSKTQAIDVLLEELLFVDEHDREYLTPDTDDFRILIYDIPEISVLCEYGIRRDEMGLPMAYMLNTNGKERMTGCKYIEVVSYDRESGNTIVRQKLVFDNEEDALHPYVAENQEFWYFFEDYSGEYGVIPDDFDEDSAIRTICDEFITDTARSGENSETIREGNIWYKIYYEDGRFFPLDSFAGLYLYSNTSEYSARNVDENGISCFTGKYQYLKNGQVVIEERDVPVTVYYSMPENHGKNNGPELSLEDVENLLNNPDDSTYFKPATTDYIYVIEQLDDAGSTIILASFDESGKLIQFVDREERTDDYGFGNTILGDYQFLSADKMVFYSDKYALFEAEGDASFTDRSRKEFLEEYEMEKEYSWESNIQIIEAK